MKSALSEYLGCGGGKGVRAVLVGTRRGDPNGGRSDYDWVARRSKTNRAEGGSARCRTVSTDRSLLASILESSSNTRLDIPRCVGFPAGDGCTVL